MNQEITYTPSVLDYIDAHIQLPAEGIDFIKLLDENISCFDAENKLVDAIEEKIFKLKNAEILMGIITDLISKKNKTKKYSVLPKRHIHFNEIEMTAVAVACKTRDKILIHNSTEEKLKDRFNGLFLLSCEQFLQPGPRNHILHSEISWELQYRETFPFNKIMSICLRGAKKLIIQDGYILNPNSKSNLISIIELAGSEMPIEIITLSDNGRNFHRHEPDNFKIKKFIREIQNNFPKHKINFSLKDRKNQIADRWIKTDTIKIRFHGLDSFMNNQTTRKMDFSIERLKN